MNINTDAAFEVHIFDAISHYKDPKLRKMQWTPELPNSMTVKHPKSFRLDDKTFTQTVYR